MERRPVSLAAYTARPKVLLSVTSLMAAVAAAGSSSFRMGRHVPMLVRGHEGGRGCTMPSEVMRTFPSNSSLSLARGGGGRDAHMKEEGRGRADGVADASIRVKSDGGIATVAGTVLDVK